MTSRDIKKFHQGQDQLCFSAHRYPDYTIKKNNNIKRKLNYTINQGNTAPEYTIKNQI
jgi:hypothetical protein